MPRFSRVFRRVLQRSQAKEYSSPALRYWRRVLEQQAAEKAVFVPVQVVADMFPAPTSAFFAGCCSVSRI
jgi:hypothetical protein